MAEQHRSTSRSEEARRRREEMEYRARRDKVRKLLGPIGRMEIFINNKYFGRIFFHPRVVALGMAGFMLFSGGKWAIDKIGDAVLEHADSIAIDNNIDASIEQEEDRYSVHYTLEYGDTIDGVINSYEPDANIAEKYKKQILSYNNLGNGNIIYAGERIKLFGVPAEHLEDFGYSCNYDLFATETEVRDRLDFLQDEFYKIKVEENSKRGEILILMKEQLSELQELTDKWYASGAGNEDDVVQEHLVDSARNLCEQFEDVFGIKFVPNCYPLYYATQEESFSKGY